MQPMQMTFMALLFAHLLGDFPFQQQWIARNKGARIWPLLCHGITHYILACTCLLLFAQVPCMAISSQAVILVYVAVHLVTDRLKHKFIARKGSHDNWKTFLLDQAVHITVLAIAAAILTRSTLTNIIQEIELSSNTKAHFLEAAITYIGVIFGGGYLIRYLTRGFAIGDDKNNAPNMQNAGLYIGWIERFLIITAIAIQSPALVGLILTGKSIARFPEFKQARFAEYFLIGTLLSFSLSVVGGILMLKLLYGSVSLR